MQNAKNRIVYWKDCDKGIIVRYMRDNGLDFMDKEKKEWISCGPNSNYLKNKKFVCISILFLYVYSQIG